MTNLTKNIALAIGSGLGVILIFTSWFFWDSYAANRIALSQRTVDWEKWPARIPEGESANHLQSNDPGIPKEARPAILLRSDSTGKNLLLKHRYGTSVYVYDSASRTITLASEEDWSASMASIANCTSQIPGDYGRGINYSETPKYEITLDGKRLRAYGDYALRVLASPTGKYTAILSAYGPFEQPKPGLSMGFESDPIVRGRRYLQILRLENGEYIQEPVRLEQSIGEYDFVLCWSDDEKYVIAYKPFENFSVIDTSILN